MAEQSEFLHGGPVPDDESDDADDGATTSTRARLGRIPVLEGVLVGAGAALVTYLFVLFRMLNLRTAAGMGPEELTEVPPAAVEAAWTVLLNLGTGLQQGDDPISPRDANVGVDVFFIVGDTIILALVATVLVGAGYLVASHAALDRPIAAALTALLIVPGWLALIVALTMFATWTPPESAEPISPIVVESVLYAGLLVPAVFGVVGGLLALRHELLDQIGSIGTASEDTS